MDVTGLLADWRQGDEQALEALMPILYAELRARAAAHMARERANHTLQPTALVHEVFFRLVEQNELEWQSRAHFLGVAAKLMRLILIDHARAKKAAKREGDAQRVTLDENLGWEQPRQIELLALDAALEDLAELDERQARLVELRFFGGLTIEESAEVLAISVATVKREWRMAKAWLRTRMNDAT